MDMIKTEATLKGIQGLKNEITAWEGRLTSVKMELDGLTKRRDLLKEECKNMAETIEQQAQQKYAEIRKETATLEDAKEKLAADKAEFTKILVAFKQDQNALLREKQAAVDARKNADDITARCGAFVRMVKDGAEKL